MRYRYYVSQALLQNRKAEAGSIARVSAPDVEALVAKAVTEALRNNQEMAQTSDFAPDRDLISRTGLRQPQFKNPGHWKNAT